MSLEVVSRLVTGRDPVPELVLLDLRRVNRVDRSGAEFSSALASFLHRRGGQLVFSGAELLGVLDWTGDRLLRPRRHPEWCEEELLFRVRGEKGGETVRSRRMSCCTISVLTSLYA